MRIARKHNMTKTGAKARLDSVLTQLLTDFGTEASDLKSGWSGDAMRFSFGTSWGKVKGKLAVTDAAVLLDVRLPLVARVFEGRIRDEVERKLREYFPG